MKQEDKNMTLNSNMKMQMQVNCMVGVGLHLLRSPMSAYKIDDS